MRPVIVYELAKIGKHGECGPKQSIRQDIAHHLAKNSKRANRYSNKVIKKATRDNFAWYFYLSETAPHIAQNMRAHNTSFNECLSCPLRITGTPRMACSAFIASFPLGKSNRREHYDLIPIIRDGINDWVQIVTREKSRQKEWGKIVYAIHLLSHNKKAILIEEEIVTPEFADNAENAIVSMPEHISQYTLAEYGVELVELSVLDIITYLTLPPVFNVNVLQQHGQSSISWRVISEEVAPALYFIINNKRATSVGITSPFRVWALFIATWKNILDIQEGAENTETVELRLHVLKPLQSTLH